ncbi:MAG: helix-turn-helix transcriptional regulator [Clostridiales bacterium]|nr:helix-turn-helix transcriptional regulator [Clostridiales bacterium]
MDIIDRINELLALKGKTGADMSRALNLSNSIYSQWNTKKTKPSKRTLPLIAEYLDTTVEYLIGQEKKPAALSGDELDQKLEGVDFALNGAVRDLTDAQKRDVLKFVEFLKSKDD